MLTQKKLTEALRPLISLSGITGGGNVDIKVIIEQAIIQQQAANRKSWSHLGQFQLPTTFSVPAFGQALAHGLITTFGDREQVSFVSLVSIEPGDEFSRFRFVSQCVDLTENINNFAEGLVRGAISSGDDPDYQASLKAKWDDLTVGWHLSGNISFRRPLTCVRLSCNPRTKSASIETFDARSTKVEDYPDKLEHTSDLMEFVSGLSGSKIVHIGDPFYVRESRWFKFITRFLDIRAIELGRVKVNNADPEEWDFINPELEYEVWAKRN